MDKIFDSSWALRIVSLILAISLFFYVQSLANDNGQQNSNVQTDVLVDVPLEVYYDEANFIVTGLPKTVDVKIEGPVQFVLQTKLMKDYKVFVDLNSLLIGEHTVTIQTENFSDKLKVTVDPAIVNVVIEEKVTQEFRVEPEINNRMISEDFVLDTMEVTPQKVMISGAKSVIDSINYVKATVKADESIKESFNQSSNVVVLNKDLSKLDVVVEPQMVDVAVKIKPYTKEIPLVLESQTTEDSKIESMKLKQDIIVVTGMKSVVDALTNVSVKVDVSKITKTGDYEATLELPEGVRLMTEQKIYVEAVVNDETEEEFTLNID